jgi:amidase
MATFEALGIEVDTVDDLPAGPGFAGTADLWRTWLPLRHSLVGGGLVELDDDPELSAQLSPEARYELEGLTVGADGNPPLSALDVIRGAHRRAAMTAAFAEFFDRYEFAVLPTAQVFPFPVEQRWPDRIGDVTMSSYHRWMETTAVATLLGCPVISLPAGVDDRGLPMGIQVLARHGAERSLLQLARAWEQVEDRVELHRPALLG